MLHLPELRARLGQQNREERDASLTRARENFAKRKDLSKVLPIIAACDVAGLVEGKYTNGFRVIAGYGWTIYANLDVEGFLETHDKKLADLLAGISAALPGKEWSSNDSPMYKTRSYTIWEGDLCVQVEAKLKDGSEKCRRVVVGKKVEERDVFQFVCDGEEVAS